MTLALPADLKPWPIPPYPANPPPMPQWVADAALARLAAAELPECNVLHDGAELAVRYELTRDGDCYLRAVKINGGWHDPVAWLPPAAIKCLENECAELEADLRECGE